MSTPNPAQHAPDPQQPGAGGQPQGQPPAGYVPGYVPQGYMPVQMMPVPPKKNFFARHKIFTAFLIILAIIIVASIAGGSGDSGDEGTKPGAQSTAGQKPDSAKEDTAGTESTDGKDEAKDEPEEKAPERPGIGSAVRDGKFEFTVTELADGGTRIGSKDFGTDAQGRFLLVHLEVANVGDKGQMFWSGGQVIIDDQGREHESDSTAAIWLDDSVSITGDINPGNKVKGIIVFDLAEGVVPASARLHDSLFSDGVHVSLENAKISKKK